MIALASNSKEEIESALFKLEARIRSLEVSNKEKSDEILVLKRKIASLEKAVV